jgi:hypothetical protein
VSHDRDSAGPDYDEAPLDRTRNRFIRSRETLDYRETDQLPWHKSESLDEDDGGTASRHDDPAPLDRIEARFIGANAAPNYDGPDHPLSRSRFLDEDDGAMSDFDEPAPAENPRKGFLGAIGFVLLMAFIGSGAGAIWYNYGPELMSLAGMPAVEKPSVTLDQLAQEQRELTEAIAALQLMQNALQKNVAAREQDIQQLSGETRSLKTDLDALRSAVANAAVPPPVAQAPKKPPTHTPPKKKAERQPAEPQAKDEPMALSPPSH